ncbi:MAG: nucleotidyltransferase domain-containing protein [Hydrogenophaga sp.]|uniref:type VII toxin-antitoxin system MntA family adenylyltransferase antitoxin n=1 Tax=Hydrogenophaga sp. TaxID=1904254 RepID=UPI00271E0078|nr:nucleotidyltransferase domain-containing protein [Hydrogenophaga sp.]MDO9481127.1 nucleotidyltransferase domain-containing protein [Hydrogenophaga sp.]MDP3343771.1 nucleotidyltransferase domain-containing protein [Hydrogenophaga sp.]MDP3805838.1 nucleotidyltransferase domain-containing protein [Hydrogenophaga sp.]MDZ4240138.1 nucleotidyltransferase domain-containing protein [Hydrogenophaga sp.]
MVRVTPVQVHVRSVNHAHTTPLDLTQALSAQGPVLRVLQQRFPNALAFYVFGSQASGQADAQSDVDLAILLPGYANANALWDTAMELAALLNRHVDLLDLRAASTVMQHQVLTTGQRLWGDALAAGLFECFALTEKLHLDEARAGLLRDIAERGRVYG